eukprot:2619304-Prymnesium_polylepis.2
MHESALSYCCVGRATSSATGGAAAARLPPTPPWSGGLGQDDVRVPLKRRRLQPSDLDVGFV